MSVKLIEKKYNTNGLSENSIANYYGQHKSDVKRFIVYASIILLMLVLVRLSPSIPTVAAAGLCFWAIFGSVQAVQSLTLLALIRFQNPVLINLGSEIGVLTWALLLIIAAKYIPWGMMHVSKRLLPIIVFSVIVTSLSVVTSNALDISLLKIISFLIGSLSVVSVCNKMDYSEIRNVVIWLFSLMFAVVFLSLLVLPDRSVGYHLNGVGFQGILNHPQTLGTFLAPLTAFFAGRFVFGKSKIITMDLFIVILLVFIILITQARTSAVAVTLSLFFTFIFIGITPIRARIKSKKSFAIKSIGGGLILILAIIFYQPAQDVVKEFVYKRGSENVDEALSSRKGGYESQYSNFLSSPLIGHGFGIYPGSRPYLSVSYYMGIPISAAVEKGFLPVAILEEVGIVGAFAFIYLLISITSPVLINKDPGWICLYFGCLFVNIGEAVFFSVGGMGIFYWILISVSTVVHKVENAK